MKSPKTLLGLAACLVVASCETSGPVSTSSGGGVPLAASYRCSNDVTLMVRRSGSGVQVTDSRGHDTTVPASPPGQRVRFSEGIYALIMEGRTATWFVSGQTPVECQR